MTTQSLPLSLEKTFESREELIAYIKKISPWAQGEASKIMGGRRAAEQSLSQIDPLHYAATRNYADGKVSRLSPYITHGILALEEVRLQAMTHVSCVQQIYKFLQELSWRDFWHHFAAHHPQTLWTDIEMYKTGWKSSDYADDLPADIAEGKTGVACLDQFIAQLIDTGYLHNHARMYLAAYVVHFRRVKWQAGAGWFLHHLLDGDIASNNLSWQWVASTFSHKPYIFNLENVARYFSEAVDTSPQNNQEINYSYSELTERLFHDI